MSSLLNPSGISFSRGLIFVLACQIYFIVPGAIEHRASDIEHHSPHNPSYSGLLYLSHVSSVQLDPIESDIRVTAIPNGKEFPLITSLVKERISAASEALKLCSGVEKVEQY